MFGDPQKCRHAAMQEAVFKTPLCAKNTDLVGKNGAQGRS